MIYAIKDNKTDEIITIVNVVICGETVTIPAVFYNEDSALNIMFKASEATSEYANRLELIKLDSLSGKEFLDKLLTGEYDPCFMEG